MPYHIAVQTEKPVTIRRFNGEVVSVPAHVGPVIRGIRPEKGESLTQLVDKIVSQNGFKQKGTNFDIENHVRQGDDSGLVGASINREVAARFALTDRFDNVYNEGLIVKLKNVASYDTTEAFQSVGKTVQYADEIEYSVHSGIPLKYIEEIRVVKNTGLTRTGVPKIEYGEILWRQSDDIIKTTNK